MSISMARGGDTSRTGESPVAGMGSASSSSHMYLDGIMSASVGVAITAGGSGGGSGGSSAGGGDLILKPGRRTSGPPSDAAPAWLGANLPGTVLPPIAGVRAAELASGAVRVDDAEWDDAGRAGGAHSLRARAAVDASPTFSSRVPVSSNVGSMLTGSGVGYPTIGSAAHMMNGGVAGFHIDSEMHDTEDGDDLERADHEGGMMHEHVTYYDQYGNPVGVGLHPDAHMLHDPRLGGTGSEGGDGTGHYPHEGTEEYDDGGEQHSAKVLSWADDRGLELVQVHYSENLHYSGNDGGGDTYGSGHCCVIS